jgi:hypothetical protein
MDSVVLETRKAGLKIQIQRYEKLKQRHHKPRRDYVCRPEEQESIDHIKKTIIKFMNL